MAVIDGQNRVEDFKNGQPSGNLHVEAEAGEDFTTAISRQNRTLSGNQTRKRRKVQR
jgi:hypothetical protein